MKFKFPHIYLLLFTLCIWIGSTSSSMAQVVVSNSIDSLQLLIGEQTKLHFKVTAPKGKKVIFPVLNDSTVKGLEILETYPIDTNKVADQWTLTQSYLVTSFDSAVYIIPSLPIKVDGVDYATNPLALKVITIPVDTTQYDAFYGPADVHNMHHEWTDYLIMIICFPVALFLIGLVIYLLTRYTKNKPIIRIIKKTPPLPPYDVAMEQIKALKKESTTEDTKRYYTELIDILRTYLQKRFGFDAPEMTTAEIICELQRIEDPIEINHLKSLLETADLVKFAKYATQINEDDRNLMTAVTFIDSTKAETTGDPQEPIIEEVVVTGRSAKRQRWLLVAIIALSLVAVATIGVGISEVIDLLF